MITLKAELFEDLNGTLAGLRSADGRGLSEITCSRLGRAKKQLRVRPVGCHDD